MRRFIPALFLVACGQPISVPFALHVKGEPIDCGATVAMDGIDVDLVDARFYVSNMVLVDSQDRYNQLRFDRDDAYQHDDVALLDFEDGTGACDGGTAQVHTTLVGETRAPDIYEISFLLGVPTDLNAADLTTQDAPLNDPDMHAGFDGNLYTSIDLLRDEAPWTARISGTGCDFTTGGATCERENLARVSIPYQRDQTVVLDLDVLLIGAGVPGDEQSLGCESDPDEPGCVGVYQTLGLDLETGASMAPAMVFSAE